MDCFLESFGKRTRMFALAKISQGDCFLRQMARKNNPYGAIDRVVAHLTHLFL